MTLPTQVELRRPVVRWRYAPLAGLAAAAVAFAPASAPALLPNSPRVQALLKLALDSLESEQATVSEEKQLGGKCVVALALYKGGRKGSPRIEEALKACRDEIRQAEKLDTYSHGLAVITLASIEPDQNRQLCQQYLDALVAKQKKVGGWGYDYSERGDTSQTQYVALGLWQAHRIGVTVKPDVARGLVDWLLRTQDPQGAWGYQGIEAETLSKPVAQNQVTPTMAAAGGASLMITTDLHGLLNVGLLESMGDLSGGSGKGGSGASTGLPSAVRPVMEGSAADVRPLPPGGVDWGRVNKSLVAAETWMERQPVSPPERWAYYYLYALERYESFREARAGNVDLEPAWYERGVEFLESNQEKPGIWEAGCGPLVDTGFVALFLLRSTQKSLTGGIGEGSMVGGRGLPKNLASARLRRGQVVVDMDEVGVGDFLSMIDKGEADRLDALASDPLALVVGDLSQADAERLEQTLRTGDPEQRLLAATALGRTGDLDRVPALLYGLTDPDVAVTLAARDGLRFSARRPRGFGMPDDFNDDQRYSALENWKRWYTTLRPEAIIDLGR